MKTFFTLALWCILGGLLTPLNAQFTWANPGQGVGYDDAVATCSDGMGNIFVYGQMGAPTATYILANGGSVTLTNNGGTDVFLAKYNPAGQLLWINNYGGSGNERPWQMHTEGGCGLVVITGQFGSSSVQFGSNTLNLSSGTDGYIVAFDQQTGTPQWANSVQGPGNSDFRDVFVTADGIYATGSIAGSFATVSGNAVFNTAASGLDILLARYNLDGTLDYVAGYGNTGDQTGFRLAVDAGRIYLMGRYTVQFTFGTGFTTPALSSGNSDFYTISIDALNPASFDWLTTGGGAATDNFHAISTDHEGEVYLHGNTQSSEFIVDDLNAINIYAPAPAIITVKLSAVNGSGQWIRMGQGPGFDFGNGMEIDQCGNIHVVGRYTGSGIDFDGNTLTGGNTYGNTYLVTYDQQGNVLTAQGVTSTASWNQATDVTVTHDNQPVIVGRYWGNLSLPGVGSVPTVPITDQNFFVAKGSGSGGSDWQQTSANTIGAARGRDVVVDIKGNVYITGTLEEVTTLGSGANSLVVNGSGMFTAKYSDCGKLIWVAHTVNGYAGANGITLDEVNGWVYVCGGLSSTGTETFESGFSPVLPNCGASQNGSGASYIARYRMSDGCLDHLKTYSNNYVVKSIDVTSDGHIYLAAEYPFGGATQVATSRFNENFVFQWFKSTSNNPGSFITANDIVVHESANGGRLVYVTGGFTEEMELLPYQVTTAANMDAYVFHIRESSGGIPSVEWLSQGNAAKQASGTSITVDPDGHAYVTGDFQKQMSPAFGNGNLVGVGLSTAFVARLNNSSAGIATWSERIYAFGGVLGTGISGDCSGLYLTGYWHGGDVNAPLNFPTSQGIVNPIFNGNANAPSKYLVYVSRFSYDNTSGSSWATSTEGQDLQRSAGIAVNNSHYAYTTGQYIGTMDLPPYYAGQLGQITSTSGVDDAFLIRNDQINSEFTKVGAYSAPALLEDLQGPQVFPNPSEGLIQVQFSSTTEANLKVLDLSGQLIAIGQTVAGNASLDLSHLPSGMYLLQWANLKTGERGTRRLVLQ